MDAHTLSVATASWGVLSGIALGVLGAFALSGGSARPRGGLAFGMFAIFWGVQIALGNLAIIFDDPTLARLLYLLFLCFALPTTYLLVEFAASQDPSPRHKIAWLALRVVIGGSSLLSAVLFVLDPGFIYGGVQLLPDRVFPVWGPLYPFLIVVPHFLAFALALLTLHAATRQAATHRIAERYSITLIGLGIYAAFAAGNNGVFYIAFSFFGSAFGGGEGPVPPSAYVFTALFVVLACVVLAIAASALRRIAIARDRHEVRRARLLALAFTLPLVWGAVEGYLALEALPRLETVGLWRLGTVAVIAYGIARWRIYDLPRRAKRAAANATGASAALAGGAAAYGAGTLASATPTLPVVAGALVLAAALIPSLNFARRLFGVERRTPDRDLDEALYGERIDAYRAAVEASLARGTLDEDGAFLAALRERFGITPDEERVLAHLARGSVIAPRSTRAWDAYERLRLLGEGGGGRTWLARDRARDRLVVLKEPLERWQQDPATRETVLREARMAAKVRHPNVVTVEDVVEGKGSPIIVMEYLEGGSLGNLLRAKGTLPWSDARHLALDVLRGLEAIHAGGIVHRDIKPSNILLTGEGVGKVADFGIAVSPASSGQRTMLIDPAHSTIAGTLHYMAPEARAGAPPDRRADLFACAAVLHEMLYGAPPGLHSPTVERRDLPVGLAPLMARALAMKPEDRYPTARAFADELAKLP